MDELMSDTRFAHIAKDPKFKRIPRAERKVKIDKRFQGMFNDKKFAVHYTVDKRGRPVNQSSSENLRKYYDLSSSEEEDETEAEELDQQKQTKPKEHKKKESKEKKIRRSKDNSPKDNLNSEEDDIARDNCFSSNGELLRIKPKKECDIVLDAKGKCDPESESESDVNDEINAKNLKADLKASKQQLSIINKNESNTMSDKIKEKLNDLSINYARGEGLLMTDSSSDEESSEASGNIYYLHYFNKVVHYVISVYVTFR